MMTTTAFAALHLRLQNRSQQQDLTNKKSVTWQRLFQTSTMHASCQQHLHPLLKQLAGNDTAQMDRNDNCAAGRRPSSIVLLHIYLPTKKENSSC